MLIRESQIVFVQIAGLGIFKRHPSKINMIDRYYSTEEVIVFLNQEGLKVCITDQNQYVIETNFSR